MHVQKKESLQGLCLSVKHEPTRRQKNTYYVHLRTKCSQQH